ncbi:MAG: hypothetical protein RIM84_24625 [Alphaproteobacteria bacterium]
MTDRADSHRSHRKTRDRSMVLVLVGTVLLMPPLVGSLLVDGKIGGIPIPLLAIFAIWGALIAGAAVLSRQLRETEAQATAPPDSEP